MSTNLKRLPLACVGLTGLLTFVAWAGEEEVSLDQVPAAVKAVILAEAAGAQITEIERETKNGRTVYEAEFVTNGQEVEIKIAPDGTLLGREIEDDDDDDDHVTIGQIPEAARSALLRFAGGATIIKVEREMENGAEIYEAKWIKNGATHEAEVTADGALVELEEIISVDKAPHVVRSAIAKHFANAGKVVVAKKTIIVYEVETVIDGREREFYILPTGQVHGEHGDDGDDHDDDDDEDDEDDDDDDD